MHKKPLAGTSVVPLSALGQVFWRAASLIGFACLAVIGLAAWQVNNDYQETLQEYRTSLVNLAATLNRQTEADIRETQTILLGLADRFVSEGDSPQALARLSRFARRQADLVPKVEGIFIYDRDGHYAIGTVPGASPGQSNADRDYFQYHRTHPATALYIGPPVVSRTSGRENFTVSIRIGSPQGEFLGVALASMSVEAFRQDFRQLKLDTNGIASLTRNDGTILVRAPPRPETAVTNIHSSPIFAALRSGQREGALTFQALVDGVRRIYGFSSSQQYPMVLMVAMAEDTVLAPWKRRLEITYAIIAIALLIMVTLGWLIIAGLRRQARLERRLHMSHRSLASANEALELMATLDPLTGLANRRGLDAALTAAFSAAHTREESLAFLLIDVDHFKRYNDTYGHQAGDQCLMRVADIINAHSRRTSDLVARYGGEEIALLLPATDRLGAEAVAAKLHESIREARIANANTDTGLLTLSIGIASGVPGQAFDNVTELVRQADEALYIAKANGRNQTQVY